MKSEDYTVPRAAVAFPEKDCMPKKASRTTDEADSEINVAKRLRYFEQRSDSMVQTVRQLVETESPREHQGPVESLGAPPGRRFGALGGHAKFHPTPNFG